MVTSNLSGTGIVFSCDEAYFFLARGLVLSLNDAGHPSGDVRLILIDVGCGRKTLAWMRNHGVEIVEIPPGLIPASVAAVIRPVHRAQVVRPFLPTLLPQLEHFVWLDCDLWVQDSKFINVMLQGAIVAPSAVMMAPGNSHYNLSFYISMHEVLEWQRGWFQAGYEPAFAEKLAVTLHFSSGVFSMRRDSSIWALWAREIEYLYPVVANRAPHLLHLAEQIALNVVAFNTQNYIRLDPLYNFHCNNGGALRRDDGKVVSNLLLPTREIAIVHLAAWSHLRRYYIDNRLLYRSGEYLTEAERDGLGRDVAVSYRASGASPRGLCSERDS
jgi:hypothetical protein